jgi:hypothetical protein
MFLSWSALALIILAAAVAWFWQDSLAARERANAAAIEACERLSLQFLDGTVAFARIALIRGTGGWLVLRRTYVFDYTANSIERLQGFVILTSQHVETVGYAPGESERQARLRAASVDPLQQPRAPGAGAAPASGAKILSLEEWRATHRSSAQQPRESREDRGDGRQ